MCPAPQGHRVNLRHAATLALVGWYLMVPPYVNRKLSTDASLSKWEVYVASDSAHECESSKTATLKLLEQEKITGKDNGVTERGAKVIALLFQLTNSQCIASDDPRLKETK
jgi:hypothetical protein